MGPPLVSVLMPVHNEALYVGTAIESVLSQSFTDFELIVIDDGSTDDTCDHVSQFAGDERVVLLRPGRVGKNAAFNLGYNASRGKWILYFAGDDIMPPDSIETRLDALQGFNPETDRVCCYGRLRMFSKDPRFNGLVVPKDPNKGTKSGGTLMFSRAAASKVFPLPTELANEDTWTRLVLDVFCEYVAHVGNIVLEYRIHSGNSLRRNDRFEIINEQRHARSIHYRLFLERYASEISDAHRAWISALARAEELRYAGKWGRILLMSEISWKTRLRFVGYAHPLFYRFRQAFYRLFSGWGGE